MRWAALCGLMAGGAIAAGRTGGAGEVAWLTPAAWPDGLGTDARFDVASTQEVLELARAVTAAKPSTPGEARWLEEQRPRVLEAYREATHGTTPQTWEELSVLTWRAAPAHAVFWDRYVAEQLHLARLFPNPTSEVFRQASSDLLGPELEEKTFALTFDDGPTAPGGSSDATVAVLRALKLPGTFFALGSRLSERSDAGALYDGVCLASHGQTHVAHVEAKAAAQSVGAVQAQLRGLHGRSDLFRPPYGQRSAGVVSTLEALGVRSVLWSIDSQDWRADATGERAAGRVLALMLARRRGVVLFHDVHPVAAEALPRVVKALGATSVHWVDCAKW